ncbi:aldo-keto reductase family 1 member C13 [Dothidotthia symphoricarpi CBS 119687]|uniref:Aldo-keto reductase family 1 member C13 n=1 Tax=Dothidotthia symphoricarpi CBS 119687 TaxID=1392245 RepID=A0A6A6ADA4_9PLEO|nr:aldo-keto reductase family 1 member C13 [Dothidotthia symphoricarpi CBS 119687]KAF2128857.1 aldo-keto reductase family 1 member C13 [Dothidotthia symphoricarpi CBS 119687]
MAKLDIFMPSLKLNDGTSMPMLGYGTGTAWYKTGDESKIDQACIDAVKTAIGLGYTHLDGAEIYKTETELGTAIKDGGVPREKLYIVTKNPGNTDIEGSLRGSLKKLQVDQVDLYLVHQPFPYETEGALQKVWADMEAVQQAGLTKSIGVSNFQPQHLNAILKTAKVIPACNQIEFHPYLQHPELLELHKKHGIATTAYGPLSAVTKAKPGPLDDYFAALTKKYAVSEAEISLRWCIDQDVVPITTSSKEQRLSDYLRCATFKLTPVEVKKINELGQTKHFRGFWTHIIGENDRT